MGTLTPRLGRLLKSLVRILIISALAIITPILLFQNKLIYHPRPYAQTAMGRHFAIVPLIYATSQGRQQSYYLPPRTLPLRHLWVLFNGNGSLALNWSEFLNPPADPHDGFMLIEYPGYGECQGFASPESIQESAEGAFACLSQSLHAKPADLEENLNVLCHSIGCAAGLNFAVHHPVDRIILVAPFTCLRDMARRVVGWPLCWLLLHNFDNRARLGELAARPHPPRVTIFHGEEDDAIPIAMGRELAGRYPGMVDFHAVPGAGHNTVLFDSAAEISALMRE